MSDKQTKRATIEHLSGTIVGKRFTVILDNIKIGDKWEGDILPVLERDGLGKSILMDGTPAFEFKGSTKPTIQFAIDEGKLQITAFYEGDATPVAKEA